MFYHCPPSPTHPPSLFFFFQNKKMGINNNRQHKLDSGLQRQMEYLFVYNWIAKFTFVVNLEIVFLKIRLGEKVRENTCNIV